MSCEALQQHFPGFSTLKRLMLMQVLSSHSTFNPFYCWQRAVTLVEVCGFCPLLKVTQAVRRQTGPCTDLFNRLVSPQTELPCPRPAGASHPSLHPGSTPPSVADAMRCRSVSLIYGAGSRWVSGLNCPQSIFLMFILRTGILKLKLSWLIRGGGKNQPQDVLTNNRRATWHCNWLILLVCSCSSYLPC